MTSNDPTQYVWWLVSRASGIVALGLISVSVLIGLAMANKLIRRPPLKRAMLRLHEHVALAGLVAISLHGVALLGDHWLKPGVTGIAVPFTMGYRPLFTGLGIIAGYLAAILGLSYYVRRRIGGRLWRKLHRATVAVWVLGIIHTLGAGSDASAAWLRAIVLVTGIPIVYLTLLRLLPWWTRTPLEPARPAAAERRPAVADAPASARGLRPGRTGVILRPLREEGS